MQEFSHGHQQNKYLSIHLSIYLSIHPSIHPHGIRQTVGGTSWTPRGKNKQSDRMAGRQNKTRMTMGCYGDVLLFTKTGIKYIKWNYFVTILHNYSSWSACGCKMQLSLNFFYCKPETKVKLPPALCWLAAIYQLFMWHLSGFPGSGQYSPGGYCYAKIISFLLSCSAMFSPCVRHLTRHPVVNSFMEDSKKLKTIQLYTAIPSYIVAGSFLPAQSNFTVLLSSTWFAV